MEPLIYFGSMVLVSIPVTALICRFRLARKKRVYWGTVLVGALVASLIVFLAAMIYFGEAGDLLRPGSWLPEGKSPGGLFVITVPAFLCVLPAVAVVAYYQRRQTK
jgi:hypothetical protein